MGNVKRMIQDAESIAINALDSGGDYVDALDKVFDFVWANALDEESERDRAWGMAKSIVLSIANSKGEMSDE